MKASENDAYQAARFRHRQAAPRAETKVRARPLNKGSLQSVDLVVDFLPALVVLLAYVDKQDSACCFFVGFEKLSSGFAHRAAGEEIELCHFVTKVIK